MNLSSFFAELKRRNVYKVAVAYAIVGWLLVQVATQVFPFFEIPNWAVRLIVLAIVIGFPIAVVIAWAFELTPEGLKRTEDVDQTAIVSVRPQMRVGQRIDQLHIDAHLIVRFLHAAFEDVHDSELFCDLAQI